MKRITLCALFLTLFLLISCNTSGKNLTDDEVAKSDGTVIDLAKITNNIKDSVAFARSVTEVHSLVKSIDELAKAIKKKVDANGLTDNNEADKNSSLVAGVYQIITKMDTKLTALEAKSSESLKVKFEDVKKASKAFLDKLKQSNADLGKDAEVPKAIGKNDNSGDKGGKELLALNTAVDALLTAADAAVTSAINELIASTKP
ncbi:Vsp/OspC family lipoprotein (plasmid) [Borrelia puertoricensis]|uniref:Vsp/OspC family lipoprotein n=1 Tax=Borrelia puertoricensis TaxID=2756107 RepID=UPI003EC10B50